MGSRLEKNSNEVRKRIENHKFQDEQGEEYGGSKFGGFTDYFRRKKIKLQNLDVELRSQSTDRPPIFRGVVAHVNGYTQPSLRDLHNLVVSYGGGFQQYLDGKTTVTHVIASNLTPKKKVEFARYRIVKPAWVVDSVNAGKLMPWDSYRIVDEGITQKVLGFDGGQVVSQANTPAQGYRGHSETSWYASQVRNFAQKVNVDDSTDIELRDDESANIVDDAYDVYSDGGEDIELEQTERDDHTRMDDMPFLNAERIDEPSELDHSGLDLVAGSLLNNAENSINKSQNNSVNRRLLDEPQFSKSMTPDSVIEKPPASLRSPEKRALTAEEHNAVLLSNPHLAKSSTANPDFLNQYYRESRLHHLSTWKADLKAQLQARAAEKSASQRGREKSAAGIRRYIMHVDFDSFFAAVSLRKNPQLADKPVVIAHGSGPGSEIASCNYPARKFGVKNGMWMKSALQLCPDLKVLPYDFKAYEEASRHFYDAILAVDGIVQSISIDEALIEVSKQCISAGGSDGKAIQEDSVRREQAKASELAGRLRALVKDKTGCDVSVGIGNNILLAKVALRKAKPAGQYLILPEEALDLVGELAVTELPGVAYSIGHKLEEIGIKYVKDIRAITKERLSNTLGPKTGEKLWDYSQAIDRTEVGEQVVRKSVSAEINWGIRFVTQQQAEEFVQCLCDELHKRLHEQAVKGKQLTMKIMRKAADAGLDPPKSLGHGKCDTFNKCVVLGVATNDKEVLGKEAISILRGYGFPPGELRGLGVQMQKLEPLKPVTSIGSAVQDNSQRRLQFKKPDTPFTPLKQQSSISENANPGATSSLLKATRLNDTTDPIEEVATPQKPARWSVINGPLENPVTSPEVESKRTALNIMGTQFILPSQIDPSVLGELPSDIRSKLAPRQKQITENIARELSPIPISESEQGSRPGSPFLGDLEQGLPSESQIDPEILRALPEDVREELLSHYKTVASRTHAGSRNQQLLPQSSQKTRSIFPSKKSVVTPTKKQKVSTMFGRGKSKSTSTTASTLTQSNFVSLANLPSGKAHSEALAVDEISESFLEELPEDIRIEILAEQKKNRLKSKSGLSVTSTRRKHRTVIGADNDPAGGQKKLILPPRPEKPTFTSRKLSTLPELRDAMSAWVEEFSGDGEEGPFEEDVTALVSYLSRVVADELDMEKAAGVVNWISYLVHDRDLSNLQVPAAWNTAIRRLKRGVQDAVQERGLAPMDFTNS